MAKKPRVDPALLAREYVFDSSPRPISVTALADKHGYGRTHVADMARRGTGLTQPNGGSIKSWYQARKEVRAAVGEKVLDALTDRWAETEAALRNRMLETAVTMLDKIDEGLEDGSIKVTAKDFPQVSAVIRVMLGDIAAVSANREQRLINPEEDIHLDPAKYAEAVADLKQLLSGREEEATNGTLRILTGTGSQHAEGDAASGPEGAVAD